jgi:hypothetical protein
MQQRQLVRTVGRDHEHRQLGDATRQVQQQLARRRVGPVHVFEDEQDRPELGEPPQRQEDRIERTGLGYVGRRGGGRGLELGEQSGQVRGHRSEHAGGRAAFTAGQAEAQRVHEGPVRGPVLLARAAPLDDARLASARELAQLPAETTLADAGLAAHERHAAPSCDRAVQQVPQRLLLVFTSDEHVVHDRVVGHRTLHERRHAPVRTSPPRPCALR